MNITEALEKVKAIFSAEEKPEEKQFAQWMLEDGVTSIEAEALEVGQAVTVGGEVAPDGSYTLQDGMVVSVEGGMIASITEAPAPEEVDEMGAKFAAIEEKFATQEQSISNLTLSLSKTIEATEGLIKIVETLTKTPTEDPVEKPNSFRSSNYVSKKESFERMVEALKKIKNKK